MSIQIRSGLAAAALAAFLTACSGPADEPEPAGESVAAAMPETPDRSETAADEAAVAAGSAPAPTPAAPAPADAPAKKDAPAY